MSAEFTVNAFLRANYCPATNSFWSDPMAADPTWQPRSERDLARHPPLRHVDRAAFLQCEGQTSWSLSLFDLRGVVVHSNESITQATYAALTGGLFELLGVRTPVATIVSEGLTEARIRVEPGLLGEKQLLLAFFSALAIRRGDWSSDDEVYQPLVISVETDAGNCTRLFVTLDWLGSARGWSGSVSEHAP
jgi:hypothetical protein